MIKAYEARTMVEEAVKEEIARYTAKATQFCEELSKEIEEKAKAKVSGFVFSIPENIIKSYVIDILKDNGYQVELQADGRIQLMW